MTQRQKGLAHLGNTLAHMLEPEDNDKTLPALENNAHAKTEGTSDWRAYRSAIRLAVEDYTEAYRSRAQSPPPPRRGTEAAALPKCRHCESNKAVTFKFVQRRSGDEGMTPVYTCENCNKFWTG